ncbi:MAG: TolC family protein [Sphingomonadales bacterium]|nr:TolC family protein [Sphingomonadales bacterium]
MRSKFGLAALLLSCAGCAHYAPRPLADNPAVLQEPVLAALETKASAVQRPWLTPTNVDMSQPLTPSALSAIAVVNNPDLIAMRSRAGLADAQVFAAGLLPDPSFNFGLDKVLSGPDTLLNIAGAIGLDLNALRTRAATRRKAVEEQRQVRLDIAWNEWQTAGAARLQAVRIEGLETQLSILRAQDEDARWMLARNAAAASRGDVAASAAEAARVAAADAADKLRGAEGDLLTARQQLARLLGLPPDSKIAIAPAPPPPHPPGAAELFGRAAVQRTDLAALRAGYDAQEAAVRLAILAQFPTLNLTLNANRDTGGNFILGPSIDFTLPLWNRNRGGIAVEEATRDALRAEYDARLFQARADIFAACATIDLAWRQRANALASLEGLRRQASASRAAATRGDLSISAAISAEQQLRDRELLVAASEQTIREQVIALELLGAETSETWTK